MVKQNDFIKSKENLLVEVYGSLLNCNERRGIFCAGGLMEARGEIKRNGKLSFGRRSIQRCEAVLNFVKTGNPTHVYYTKVYEVDKKAFYAIMIREMGLETARKFMCGKRIKPDDYRPVKMSSEFGETYIFVIPEEGRRLTLTNSEAPYVRIVREGIYESFSGGEREVNLKALERAIVESQKQSARN
jgi:hypothetical protein